MKHYIIDGNNVIMKSKILKSLQRKDKQASREVLAFKIEEYFRGKKIKISLYYDGYKNLPIKTFKTKIIYGENKIADDRIKIGIENSKNPKNIILVSSDNNLKDFARVCGCSVLTSEDFVKQIYKSEDKDEEKRKIDSMNDVELFKKLFKAK